MKINKIIKSIFFISMLLVMSCLTAVFEYTTKAGVRSVPLSVEQSNTEQDNSTTEQSATTTDAPASTSETTATVILYVASADQYNKYVSTTDTPDFRIGRFTYTIEVDTSSDYTLTKQDILDAADAINGKKNVTTDYGHTITNVTIENNVGDFWGVFNISQLKTVYVDFFGSTTSNYDGNTLSFSSFDGYNYVTFDTSTTKSYDCRYTDQFGFTITSGKGSLEISSNCTGTLANEDALEILAGMVNNSYLGEDYAKQSYKGAGGSVSEPIGSEETPFIGTFNGQCKSYDGPVFGYTNGATISQMNITGTITTNQGLVANNATGTTVSECILNATATGNGACGAVFGRTTSSCSIEYCKINGNSSNSSARLYSGSGSVSLTQCIYEYMSGNTYTWSATSYNSSNSKEYTGQMPDAKGVVKDFDNYSYSVLHNTSKKWMLSYRGDCMPMCFASSWYSKNASVTLVKINGDDSTTAFATSSTLIQFYGEYTNMMLSYGLAAYNYENNTDIKYFSVGVDYSNEFLEVNTDAIYFFGNKYAYSPQSGYKVVGAAVEYNAITVYYEEDCYRIALINPKGGDYELGRLATYTTSGLTIEKSYDNSFITYSNSCTVYKIDMPSYFELKLSESGYLSRIVFGSDSVYIGINYSSNASFYTFVGFEYVESATVDINNPSNNYLTYTIGTTEYTSKNSSTLLSTEHFHTQLEDDTKITPSNGWLVLRPIFKISTSTYTFDAHDYDNETVTVKGVNVKVGITSDMLSNTDEKVAIVNNGKLVVLSGSNISVTNAQYSSTKDTLVKYRLNGDFDGVDVDKYTSANLKIQHTKLSNAYIVTLDYYSENSGDSDNYVVTGISNFYLQEIEIASSKITAVFMPETYYYTLTLVNVSNATTELTYTSVADSQKKRFLYTIKEKDLVALLTGDELEDLGSSYINEGKVFGGWVISSSDKDKIDDGTYDLTFTNISDAPISAFDLNNKLVDYYFVDNIYGGVNTNGNITILSYWRDKGATFVVNSNPTSYAWKNSLGSNYGVAISSKASVESYTIDDVVSSDISGYVAINFNTAENVFMIGSDFSSIDTYVVYQVGHLVTNWQITTNNAQCKYLSYSGGEWSISKTGCTISAGDLEGVTFNSAIQYIANLFSVEQQLPSTFTFTVTPIWEAVDVTVKNKDDNNKETTFTYGTAYDLSDIVIDTVGKTCAYFTVDGNNVAKSFNYYNYYNISYTNYKKDDDDSYSITLTQYNTNNIYKIGLIENESGTPTNWQQYSQGSTDPKNGQECITYVDYVSLNQNNYTLAEEYSNAYQEAVYKNYEKKLNYESGGFDYLGKVYGSYNSSTKTGLYVYLINEQNLNGLRKLPTYDKKNSSNLTLKTQLGWLYNDVDMYYTEKYDANDEDQQETLGKLTYTVQEKWNYVDGQTTITAIYMVNQFVNLLVINTTDPEYLNDAVMQTYSYTNLTPVTVGNGYMIYSIPRAVLTASVNGDNKNAFAIGDASVALTMVSSAEILYEFNHWEYAQTYDEDEALGYTTDNLTTLIDIRDSGYTTYTGFTTISGSIKLNKVDNNGNFPYVCVRPVYNIRVQEVTFNGKDIYENALSEFKCYLTSSISSSYSNKIACYNSGSLYVLNGTTITPSLTYIGTDNRTQYRDSSLLTKANVQTENNNIKIAYNAGLVLAHANAGSTTISNIYQTSKSYAIRDIDYYYVYAMTSNATQAKTNGSDIVITTWYMPRTYAVELTFVYNITANTTSSTTLTYATNYDYAKYFLFTKINYTGIDEERLIGLGENGGAELTGLSSAISTLYSTTVAQGKIFRGWVIDQDNKSDNITYVTNGSIQGWKSGDLTANSTYDFVTTLKGVEDTANLVSYWSNTYKTTINNASTDSYWYTTSTNDFYKKLNKETVYTNLNLGVKMDDGQGFTKTSAYVLTTNITYESNYDFYATAHAMYNCENTSTTTGYAVYNLGYRIKGYTIKLKDGLYVTFDGSKWGFATTSTEISIGNITKTDMKSLAEYLDNQLCANGDVASTITPIITPIWESVSILVKYNGNTMATMAIGDYYSLNVPTSAQVTGKTIKYFTASNGSAVLIEDVDTSGSDIPYNYYQISGDSYSKINDTTYSLATTPAYSNNTYKITLADARYYSATEQTLNLVAGSSFGDTLNTPDANHKSVITCLQYVNTTFADSGRTYIEDYITNVFDSECDNYDTDIENYKNRIYGLSTDKDSLYIYLQNGQVVGTTPELKNRLYTLLYWGYGGSSLANSSYKYPTNSYNSGDSYHTESGNLPTNAISSSWGYVEGCDTMYACYIKDLLINIYLVKVTDSNYLSNLQSKFAYTNTLLQDYIYTAFSDHDIEVTSNYIIIKEVDVSTFVPDVENKSITLGSNTFSFDFYDDKCEELFSLYSWAYAYETSTSKLASVDVANKSTLSGVDTDYNNFVLLDTTGYKPDRSVENVYIRPIYQVNTTEIGYVIQDATNNNVANNVDVDLGRGKSSGVHGGLAKIVDKDSGSSQFLTINGYVMNIRIERNGGVDSKTKYRDSSLATTDISIISKVTITFTHNLLNSAFTYTMNWYGDTTSCLYDYSSHYLYDVYKNGNNIVSIYMPNTYDVELTLTYFDANDDLQSTTLNYLTNTTYAKYFLYTINQETGAKDDYRLIGATEISAIVPEIYNNMLRLEKIFKGWIIASGDITSTNGTLTFNTNGTLKVFVDSNLTETKEYTKVNTLKGSTNCRESIVSYWGNTYASTINNQDTTSVWYTTTTKAYYSSNTNDNLGVEIGEDTAFTKTNAYKFTFKLDSDNTDYEFYSTTNAMLDRDSSTLLDCGYAIYNLGYQITGYQIKLNDKWYATYNGTSWGYSTTATTIDIAYITLTNMGDLAKSIDEYFSQLQSETSSIKPEIVPIWEKVDIDIIYYDSELKQNTILATVKIGEDYHLSNLTALQLTGKTLAYFDVSGATNSKILISDLTGQDLPYNYYRISGNTYTVGSTKYSLKVSPVYSDNTYKITLSGARYYSADEQILNLLSGSAFGDSLVNPTKTETIVICTDYLTRPYVTSSYTLVEDYISYVYEDDYASYQTDINANYLNKIFGVEDNNNNLYIYLQNGQALGSEQHYMPEFKQRLYTLLYWGYGGDGLSTSSYKYPTSAYDTTDSYHVETGNLPTSEVTTIWNYDGSHTTMYAYYIKDLLVNIYLVNVIDENYLTHLKDTEYTNKYIQTYDISSFDGYETSIQDNYILIREVKLAEFSPNVESMSISVGDYTIELSMYDQNVCAQLFSLYGWAYCYDIDATNINNRNLSTLASTVTNYTNDINNENDDFVMYTSAVTPARSVETVYIRPIYSINTDIISFGFRDAYEEGVSPDFEKGKDMGASVQGGIAKNIASVIAGKDSTLATIKGCQLDLSINYETDLDTITKYRDNSIAYKYKANGATANDVAIITSVTVTITNALLDDSLFTYTFNFYGDTDSWMQCVDYHYLCDVMVEGTSIISTFMPITYDAQLTLTYFDENQTAKTTTLTYLTNPTYSAYFLYTNTTETYNSTLIGATELEHIVPEIYGLMKNTYYKTFKGWVIKTSDITATTGSLNFVTSGSLVGWDSLQLNATTEYSKVTTLSGNINCRKSIISYWGNTYETKIDNAAAESVWYTTTETEYYNLSTNQNLGVAVDDTTNMAKTDAYTLNFTIEDSTGSAYQFYQTANAMFGVYESAYSTGYSLYNLGYEIIGYQIKLKDGLFITYNNGEWGYSNTATPITIDVTGSTLANMSTLAKYLDEKLCATQLASLDIQPIITPIWQKVSIIIKSGSNNLATVAIGEDYILTNYTAFETLGTTLAYFITQDNSKILISDIDANALPYNYYKMSGSNYTVVNRNYSLAVQPCRYDNVYKIKLSGAEYRSATELAVRVVSSPFGSTLISPAPSEGDVCCTDYLTTSFASYKASATGTDFIENYITKVYNVEIAKYETDTNANYLHKIFGVATDLDSLYIYLKNGQIAELMPEFEKRLYTLLYWTYGGSTKETSTIKYASVAYDSEDEYHKEYVNASDFATTWNYNGQHTMYANYIKDLLVNICLVNVKDEIYLDNLKSSLNYTNRYLQVYNTTSFTDELDEEGKLDKITTIGDCLVIREVKLDTIVANVDSKSITIGDYTLYMTMTDSYCSQLFSLYGWEYCYDIDSTTINPNNLSILDSVYTNYANFTMYDEDGAKPARSVENVYIRPIYSINTDTIDFSFKNAYDNAVEPSFEKGKGMGSSIQGNIAKNISSIIAGSSSTLHTIKGCVLTFDITYDGVDSRTQYRDPTLATQDIQIISAVKITITNDLLNDTDTEHTIFSYTFNFYGDTNSWMQGITQHYVCDVERYESTNIISATFMPISHAYQLEFDKYNAKTNSIETVVLTYLDVDFANAKYFLYTYDEDYNNAVLLTADILSTDSKVSGYYTSMLSQGKEFIGWLIEQKLYTGFNFDVGATHLGYTRGTTSVTSSTPKTTYEEIAEIKSGTEDCDAVIFAYWVSDYTVTVKNQPTQDQTIWNTTLNSYDFYTNSMYNKNLGVVTNAEGYNKVDAYTMTRVVNGRDADKNMLIFAGDHAMKNAENVQTSVEYAVYNLGYNLDAWTIRLKTTNGTKYLYYNGSSWSLTETLATAQMDMVTVTLSDFATAISTLDEYYCANIWETQQFDINMLPTWSAVTIDMYSSLVKIGSTTYGEAYQLNDTTLKRTGKTIAYFTANDYSVVLKCATNKDDDTYKGDVLWSYYNIDPTCYAQDATNSKLYSIDLQPVYTNNLYRLKLGNTRYYDMTSGSASSLLDDRRLGDYTFDGTHSTTELLQIITYAYYISQNYDTYKTQNKYVEYFINEIFTPNCQAYIESVEGKTNEWQNKIFGSTDNKDNLYIYMANEQAIGSLPIFESKYYTLIYWYYGVKENGTDLSVQAPSKYLTMDYDEDEHYSEIGDSSTIKTNWYYDGSNSDLYAKYYRRVYNLIADTILGEMETGTSGTYNIIHIDIDDILFTSGEDNKSAEYYVMYVDGAPKFFTSMPTPTSEGGYSSVKLYAGCTLNIDVLDQSKIVDLLGSGTYDCLIGYRYVSTRVNVKDTNYDTTTYACQYSAETIENWDIRTGTIVKVTASSETIAYKLTITNPILTKSGYSVISFGGVTTSLVEGTSSYTIQITIGQTCTIDYYAYVGYEFEADKFILSCTTKTYGLTDCVDKQMYVLTFTGTWLRENYYEQQDTTYSVADVTAEKTTHTNEKYYGIGLIRPNTKAYTMQVVLFVYDYSTGVAVESKYTLPTTISIDNATFTLNKATVATADLSINSLSAISPNYVLTIDGTNYAILSSWAVSNSYAHLDEKTYTFVIASEPEHTFDLTKSMLNSMTNRQQGEILAEQDRKLNFAYKVSELIALNVKTIKLDDDINASTRSIVLSNGVSDLSNNKLDVSLTKNQTSTLDTSTNTTYYSNQGTIYTYNGLSNELSITYVKGEYTDALVTYGDRTLTLSSSALNNKLRRVADFVTTPTSTEVTITLVPRELEIYTTYYIVENDIPEAQATMPTTFEYFRANKTAKGCYLGEQLTIEYNLTNQDYSIGILVNDYDITSTNQYTIKASDFSQYGALYISVNLYPKAQNSVTLKVTLKDSSTSTPDDEYGTIMWYVDSNSKQVSTINVTVGRMLRIYAELNVGYSYVGYYKDTYPVLKTDLTLGEDNFIVVSNSFYTELGGTYTLVLQKDAVTVVMTDSSTELNYTISSSGHTTTVNGSLRTINNLYVQAEVSCMRKEQLATEQLDHYYYLDKNNQQITITNGELVITSSVLSNVTNNTIYICVVSTPKYKLSLQVVTGKEYLSTIKSTLVGDTVNLLVEGKNNLFETNYYVVGTSMQLALAPITIGKYSISITGDISLTNQNQIDKAITLTKDYALSVTITRVEFGFTTTESSYNSLTSIKNDSPTEITDKINSYANAYTYNDTIKLTIKRKQNKMSLTAISFTDLDLGCTLTINTRKITSLDAERVSTTNDVAYTVIGDKITIGDYSYTIEVDDNNIYLTFVVQNKITLDLKYTAIKTISP